jgi:hypothetical protein
VVFVISVPINSNNRVMERMVEIIISAVPQILSSLLYFSTSSPGHLKI